MNTISLLCFLFVLACSLLLDRKKLKRERTRVKITYGVFTFVLFGLLLSKYMNWRIPMPSRFFIHTISPWVMNWIGI